MSDETQDKKEDAQVRLDVLRTSLGTQSPSAKREQILQGAFSVFLEMGYERASMDKIAAEANVAKQTIYSNFKDKEGLFTALMDRVCSRFLESTMSKDIFELKPRQFFETYARLYLQRSQDKEFLAFMRLIVGESGRFQYLPDLYLSKIVLPSLGHIENYLNTTEALYFANPAYTARLLIGMLDSFIMTQEILGGASKLNWPADSFMEHLVETLLSTAKIK